MTGFPPSLAALTVATGLAASGLAAVETAALATLAPAPWLLNETASLPRGLYRRTAAAPTRGRIVAVSPPPAARSYLAGLGARPGARLLKRVAATSGDVVCRHDRVMTWPGGARLALSRDRRGRPLPAWSGCRRLGAGEILVVGDTAQSFDSRYFGPVAPAGVEGVYQEVWRW